MILKESAALSISFWRIRYSDSWKMHSGCPAHLLGRNHHEMMEAELDDHLGYQKSERSETMILPNGYNENGSTVVSVPWKSMCRKTENLPLNQVVKKRQKDISDIDQKIISMYAKGMTTRQISEAIEDIYGFETWRIYFWCHRQDPSPHRRLAEPSSG